MDKTNSAGPDTSAHGGLRRLSKLAILAAVSIVLVYLIRIPYPLLPFLEYDPADIPILIGTFLYGPVYGLLLTVCASAVQALTVSAASGWMGFIMHVFATGAMSVVAGVVYVRERNKKSAKKALFFGSLTMVCVMIALNLVVTPYFMGAPVSAVVDLLIPAIIPFNIIKAALNSFATYLLYKRVGKYFKV